MLQRCSGNVLLGCIVKACKVNKERVCIIAEKESYWLNDVCIYRRRGSLVLHNVGSSEEI